MKRLLGGVMLALGVLIAGASGLCSLVFAVSTPTAPTLLLIVALVGGIPFAIGWGLIAWGRKILREEAERDDAAEF